MRLKDKASVITAGLALFSMFFGAGDLIWPLILGGKMGDHNFYAMLGLLLTGVSLPLLGLLAMMLFRGNLHDFFGRLGKVPGVCLIFIVQAILGPLGTLPRLITLTYATLKPYLFGVIGPLPFSIIAALIVLAFVMRRQKMIDILGYVLTPILLISLLVIFIIGFINPPAAPPIDSTTKEAFVEGVRVGYNTLDLIASFIFAPFVLSYFINQNQKTDTLAERKSIFKKMFQASSLAAILLSLMYIGLTNIAARYTPYLNPFHAPEERLAEISHYLLGPYGGFIACIAVTMACLTTAISVTVIVSDYVSKDLLRERGGKYLAPLLTLTISAVLANIGFMGIANMLSPVLMIICPGLIVLSVLNILHKLYEMRMAQISVFAAFTATTLIGYLLRL